ncbi:hypothetical protein [Paractinoplanes toevensis]|uniref:hypothetical protein n=1 Tax=Paractinoplanes toevensis TaxID=571911 RepID=UPI001BB405B5|nr:hypothetical protein [Actinoplanes toevensis]
MEETRRRWPDPEGGPYQLTLIWTRVNGRPQVAGLHLDPISDGAPAVTTSLLRDLKLAEIMIEDREALDHIPQVKLPADVVVEGMRPATVKRLRRAAEIYLAAWRAGERPTKEVGRRMNLTPAAAANLVRRAREAGLLPPTSAGVSQG